MNYLVSPLSARTAAREHSRACAWDGSTTELDHWAASGRIASFRLRDDDAVTTSPALERLPPVAERYSVLPALAATTAFAEAAA